MSREPVESDLKHNLCRPPRPAESPFRIFEPLQVTADGEQHIGQNRPRGGKRPGDARAGSDCPVARMGGIGAEQDFTGMIDVKSVHIVLENSH